MFFTDEQEKLWRSRAGEPMSIWEYLQHERSVPIKNELRNGRLYPMGPFDFTHCLLNTNTTAAIGSVLKGKTPQCLGSGMRIWVQKTGLFTYADATIITDSVEVADDGHRDNLINPSVIIEITSPTSQKYDAGEKFELFQGLNSFIEYILVSHDRPRVECRRLSNRGVWECDSVEGIDASFSIQSVAVSLTLNDIYDKVDLN